MRRTVRLRAASALACSLACTLASTSCKESAPVGVTTTAAALYARSDTNATTVWAPRLRLAGRVGDSFGVETTLAMDAWTGASIDVVTAATEAIVEIRKEVTAGAFYEFENVTVGGGYRYSTENDYWSNGGVGNLTFDLASNNTTLAIAGFGSRDVVGYSGDPNFRRPQSSLGGRVSLTQVLDKQTVAQASWETTRVAGYQASPYRGVANGTNGLCGPVPLGARDDTSERPPCVPELHPDERFRHAATARTRRAFGDSLSMGVEYRFYFDSWGILSHTVLPDLAILIGDHGTLGVDYRYYTQGQADFYRSLYPRGVETRYRTRDRELSALYANRVGLRYQHHFELGNGDSVLTTALRTSVTRIKYLAFIGLDYVDALEATFLLSLDFR